MGQRVSIIGGSGFVGRAIVQQAVAAGHQVRVACRHPERARDLLVEGATLVKTDVVDGSGIVEAVRGADTVIYLVGLLFEKGKQNFASAHVEGVARVLGACKQAGVKQYLHMSALGAGKVAGSDYAETKATAEEMVADSGLNYTTFRPSVIYGAGDNFFNQFKSMSAMLPVLPVISGATRFQPVWVEDVARAFVGSIANKHVSSQSYELAGPKIYTLKGLLELLMGELDRAPVMIDLPDFAAKLMALFSTVLPTPLITLDQLKLLAHDNIVDGEAFPAIFGKPAAVELVLPTYIAASKSEGRQKQYDVLRQRYRKGGV